MTIMYSAPIESGQTRVIDPTQILNRVGIDNFNDL
jgi:hypothetical protein